MFWQSHTWLRVLALETIVFLFGSAALLAVARIGNARGIAAQLASLLTLP